ncbi:MAG: hypothetical protein QM519_06615 [Bacteroidia bacterium]|jgi:hypothetical protein|nr:hypothetical protein [Bacteroidia bacterium]
MRCAALIMSLLCVLPAFAQDGELAGPTWGEGPEDNGAGGTKDAGATAPTAQQVSSPLASASGSTLTRINGRTYSGLLQQDLIDLYEISITTPASFLATTQGSTFDTAIFLFRKIIGSDGVPEARAIAMNDNSPSGGVSTSKLVGSSIPGLTAGTYYIAVAKSGAMPIGFKNPDNDPLPLFTYNPGSTAVVLPTGTQATYTLADWSNLGDGGDYQIEFGGTVVTRSSACSSAIILGSGVYSFGNAGASDSSASRIGLDATCSDNGAWIANPSWFELGACDGAVQISVCPTVTTATYQMVVYEGSCGDLEPVACGTLGACSGGGTGSTVTLNPDPCKTYYVAFGARRVSGASPTSAGTITITCTPDGPSCGVAGTGSCFTPHAAPTCDSITCCSVVCAIDPFCCNSSWDNLCVSQAYTSCAPPPACPPSDPDLDGNGLIDGGDLAILLSQWGT